MLRKLIYVITLALCVKVCTSQVKYKMLVGQLSNFGQYKISILPFTYDSTLSDVKIIQCVDTLPGGMFSAKMYNLLFTGDSTKMAIQVNEGVYLFHKRYTVTEFWKNGNRRRITYYNKRFKKYWYFSFYNNACPESKGKYNGDKKKRRWVYYDGDGKKIKIEHYSADGTLKKSKDINPPKKTLTTLLNPRHTGGIPYVIQ